MYMNTTFIKTKDRRIRMQSEDYLRISEEKTVKIVFPRKEIMLNIKKKKKMIYE